MPDKMAGRFPEGINAWTLHFNQLWESMAFFLLPMGVILASSLITQIEYKNNTWKQLHTTPQSYTTVYFAKISVILLRMVQFFVFFNIGILISGLLPGIIHAGQLPFLKYSLPMEHILKANGTFFLTCMPIIALQYLMGLRFKNFIAPVGIGLALLIGSLIGISWEHNYLLPYLYTALNYFSLSGVGTTFNLYAWSAGYFVVFMLLGYLLYITRKEKG